MLFAAPKSGFSTLKQHFPKQLTGHSVPAGKPVHAVMRDPWDRWLSMYNMMVVSGGLRSNELLAEPIRDHFGLEYIQKWFPDFDTMTKHSTGIVGWSRHWLENAGRELADWAMDLHFASQHICYSRLNTNTINLVTLDQWPDHVQQLTGVNISTVNNVGVYRVPKHYFITLKPLVQEIWADDFAVWQRLNDK